MRAAHCRAALSLFAFPDVESELIRLAIQVAVDRFSARSWAASKSLRPMEGAPTLNAYLVRPATNLFTAFSYVCPDLAIRDERWRVRSGRRSNDLNRTFVETSPRNGPVSYESCVTDTAALFCTYAARSIAWHYDLIVLAA